MKQWSFCQFLVSSPPYWKLSGDGSGSL